jgi:hypothetical protein
MSFDEQQKHFGPQKHFRNEDEGPDVEGHARKARADEEQQEEAPDVEGHARKARADEEGEDDTPDFEGHARKV